MAEKGIFTPLKAWAILKQRLEKACPRLVIADSGPAKGEGTYHGQPDALRGVHVLREGEN